MNLANKLLPVIGNKISVQDMMTGGMAGTADADQADDDGVRLRAGNFLIFAGRKVFLLRRGGTGITCLTRVLLTR